MIILGVDPGTATTGCAVIEAASGGSKLRALDYGCIRTSPDLPMHVRLQQIYDALCNKVREYKPEVLAIEQLYFNKNVRTALTVGQARGVAILAAANCGLDIAEYTPLQIKLAVTGYGRASKGQIQRMVAALLCLPEIPRPDDTADALAVAICHGHSSGLDAKLLDVRRTIR